MNTKTGLETIPHSLIESNTDKHSGPNRKQRRAREAKLRKVKKMVAKLGKGK